MENLFNFKGKNVVITGGGTGLGYDAAVAFSKAGANVAILVRDPAKYSQQEKELKSLNPNNLVVDCDVTIEAQVKAAIEEVLKHFSSIHILINNAGVAVRGGVHELTEEDWDKSMNTNVKGIFLVSKYVIPNMIKNNYGKIVNLASVNAVIADKFDVFIRHGYNTSKAAVLGLTKAMACSYGRYGITVNAVGPGLFESNMTKDSLFKSEEFLNKYSLLNPVGRPGNKGELNGPLMFLASDASSYVNGEFILVDGGQTLV